MEVEQITFLVAYGDQEALFTLSEFDTIEHLKMEIDNNFGILVSNQVIHGWRRKPESDDTILKECCNPDINCLEVTTFDEKQKSCLVADDDTEIGGLSFDPINQELEAAATFNKKLPVNFPLTFRMMLLEDAVSHILNSSRQKEAKPLLLYLHNSKDSFSSQFLALAHNDDICSVLEETFLIVGWDVENESFHNSLIQTLRRYSSLSSISYLIIDKIAAAVCLFPDNSEITLFFCLRGSVSYENVKEKLQLVQEKCRSNAKMPDNDTTCKFLEVMTAEEIEKSFHDTDDDMGRDDSLNRELEAAARFNEKLPVNLPLTFEIMLLDDAVSHILNSSQQKKALLLYLHNSKDSFSNQFLALVHDHEICSILKETFLIIGWDVENPYFHDSLIETLGRYSSLSSIPYLITDKIGAAICLFPDNADIALFFCLRGNISYESIKEKLQLVQEQCRSNVEMPGNETTSMEIEAIKSLKRKLPSNISVTFRHCSLEDAINFICTSPFEQRKVLLVYLHNSANPFSKMFSESLKNSELAAILNKNYLVLGWDVEDSKYHSALVSALCQHPNLAIVSDLVTHKVSVALCILPVNGTINLFLCLRGNVTLKDCIKSLKEAEKVFHSEIEKEIELERLEQEKCNQNDIGSEKLHRIWADMLGDRDYDSFEFDQHKFLKEKVAYGLAGPPKEETGYDKNILKEVNTLYNVIATESNKIAQYRDHIEIAFIYNCLEPLPKEKIKRAKKYKDYNPQTDVKPVPVFVLRKCRGNTTNPCRVFIDHTGRVYQHWNGYLTKNKFEECEMILPRNGRYIVENEQVLLERHLSPACHLDTKLLQVGDIVSVAAGLASGAVFMTAAAGIAALPVAAPVLVAAAVTGGVAGAWAIGRSIYTLYDRNYHKESMSFAHSEARGAYLNIVAGSLGFVGAGANMAITQLAARGANISQGATYLVNTVQVLNLGAGGVSLVNSGYEVFDQWYFGRQTPSALTILQLSSSILFFGHAVYNFKGAQTIVDETQARVLQDYQDSLRSNRHRKTFNKLMKETIRTTGDNTRGQAEVISAIRNIKNKDEVFASLTRNNKAMNKAGIKFSAEGGKITLGGMMVDMSEFIGLNKKQSETFLANLAQKKTTQQPFTTSTSSTGTNTTLSTAVKNLLADINVNTSAVNLNQLMMLTTELLAFCSGDIQSKVVNAVHMAIQYIFNNISSGIAEEIDKVIPKNSQFSGFLRLGISFFSHKVDELEQKYDMWQKTGNERYYHPSFEHVNPVYIKRTVAFFEFVVRNSYSGDSLIKAALTEISRFVTAWVTRAIFENEEKRENERRRDRHSASFRPKTVRCRVCGGYYFKQV